MNNLSASQWATLLTIVVCLNVLSVATTIIAAMTAVANGYWMIGAGCGYAAFRLYCLDRAAYNTENDRA